MKRTILFLAILFLLVPMGSAEATFEYTLKDGVLTYEGYEDSSIINSNMDKTYVMNYKIDLLVTLESIDDEIVKITENYRFEMIEAFYWENGEKNIYDEYYVEYAITSISEEKNTTLEFNVVSEVSKIDGVILSTSYPYTAYNWRVCASMSDIRGSYSCGEDIDFNEEEEQTDIFSPDAFNYTDGQELNTYTDVSSGKYLDYDTWDVKRDFTSVIPTYTTYNTVYRIDKVTGSWVSTTIDKVFSDGNSKSHWELKLVDSGKVLKGTLGFEFPLLISAVMIPVLIKRRK